METEELAIFTEKMERIGTGTRAEVHARGDWHETFQCWFIKRENGKDYLLFQLRAAQKDDFPNALDITAAGHLLSHETPRDGIREIREELGIDLAFEDLIAMGIRKDQGIDGKIQHREFCHIYFYKFTQPLETFMLQREEVQGIFSIELSDFEHLIQQEAKTITGRGYLIQANGTLLFSEKQYVLADFCPHDPQYYPEIVRSAQHILSTVDKAS